MNKAEALLIVRLVKGICPATAIDTYTPDAWAEVLTETRYQDAHQAVLELATTERFIALSDILGRVKKIRSARIRKFMEANPDHLGIGRDPDDVPGYLDNLRAQLKAIGDGDVTDARAIEAAQ